MAAKRSKVKKVGTARMKELKVEANQQAFLNTLYAVRGNVAKALKTVKLDRCAVERWIEEDVGGFRKRYADLRESLVDFCEQALIIKAAEAGGDTSALSFFLRNQANEKTMLRKGYAETQRFDLHLFKTDLSLLAEKIVQIVQDEIKDGAARKRAGQRIGDLMKDWTPST